MKTLIRPALTMLALFTIVTGVLYPLAITAASTVFQTQRHGSLIVHNGTTVGSKLIGQSFTNPGHFWGRPSVTSPQPYNAASSNASNLGPSNPALVEAQPTDTDPGSPGVKERIQALRDADPDNSAPVPIDLVTSSASGLDPHISPAAAYYQVHRVAMVRHLDEAKVRDLVRTHIEGRDLAVLGEPRVNVLLLNEALDELAGGAPEPSTPVAAANTSAPNASP
jgi:K+-transporting ATPase ATPase C chain